MESISAHSAVEAQKGARSASRSIPKERSLAGVALQSADGKLHSSIWRLPILGQDGPHSNSIDLPEFDHRSPARQTIRRNNGGQPPALPLAIAREENQQTTMKPMGAKGELLRSWPATFDVSLTLDRDSVEL